MAGRKRKLPINYVPPTRFTSDSETDMDIDNDVSTHLTKYRKITESVQERRPSESDAQEPRAMSSFLQEPRPSGSCTTPYPERVI